MKNKRNRIQEIVGSNFDINKIHENKNVTKETNVYQKKLNSAQKELDDLLD